MMRFQRLTNRVLLTPESNKSKLKFLRKLAYRHQCLVTKHSSTLQMVKELTTENTSLRDGYLTENKALRSQCDDLQRKLDIIKEVLRDNDSAMAKKKLRELNISFGGNGRSSEADNSVQLLTAKDARRRMSRHSAGSLLDPENLSSDSELSASVEDTTDKRVSTTTATHKVEHYIKDVKKEMRQSALKSIPMNSDDDFFDMDIAETVTMPPIISEKRIRFDRDQDTQSLTSQGTLCESTTSVSTTSSASRFKRSHEFETKTSLRADNCYQCGRKIAFGKPISRCEACRISVHPTCISKVSPCCLSSSVMDLSSPSTGYSSNRRDNTLQLAALCPLEETPCIPSIIIHLVNEINARGLDQLGLYRVSGSDKLVKDLLDKFLRSKTLPSLSAIDDVNIICGCLKLFLRSLDEPLVTHKHWNSFASIAKRMCGKSTDSSAVFDALRRELQHTLARLPPANRDTLAYLALHLKAVAASPDCQMNMDNLARVFGPSIAGFSCVKPSVMQLVEETSVQQWIVKLLLVMPEEMYLEILDCGLNELFPNRERNMTRGSHGVSGRHGLAYVLATPARLPKHDRSPAKKLNSLARNGRNKFFASFNRHGQADVAQPESTS